MQVLMTTVERNFRTIIRTRPLSFSRSSLWGSPSCQTAEGNYNMYLYFLVQCDRLKAIQLLAHELSFLILSLLAIRRTIMQPMQVYSGGVNRATRLAVESACMTVSRPPSASSVFPCSQKSAERLNASWSIPNPPDPRLETPRRYSCRVPKEFNISYSVVIHLYTCARQIIEP